MNNLATDLLSRFPKHNGNHPSYVAISELTQGLEKEKKHFVTSKGSFLNRKTYPLCTVTKIICAEYIAEYC